MSTHTRFRHSNIPWLSHLAFLIIPSFILQDSLRTYLLLYTLLIFLFDTENLLLILQDPSEPPLIPHPYLPFLGHVIGMFHHGSNYFSLINETYNYPIYALQTLGARTIVVVSPQLAAPIQRASRNLSFYGMILEVTKRLVGLDEESMRVVRWNLDDELGTGEGLMNEAGHMVARELAPGPNLTAMSTAQLEIFSEQLNALIPSEGCLETNLMGLVKRLFTEANALAIYGPRNIFRIYPELVDRFWEYEAGMIAVMADVLPWVTARRPWLARKAVNDALQEYVEKEYYRAAAPMIQKRVQINLKHGLTPKMAGRAELILLFGITGNAVPSTFWFLANVLARPELLAQIREETRQAVRLEANTVTGKEEKIINVEILKTKCPLLVSTYRESLRMIANLASVRLVTNTHTITAPGYPPILLKKGSMIQIASGVIHVLESIWGPDAKQFNPHRFISTTTSSEQFSSETQVNSTAEHTATQLPKNVPSAAFRAFGGGSVICPGRHFAQSEILGFVTLFVHMFDVRDKETGEVIALPERDNGRIPLSVMKPAKEPHVSIRRRKGEGDVVWQLEV
ncbi:cytochrome P450 [Lojkania enalia]|uniref:Cytochrome P450 n=1 Tax=Lojkania enalia TaxID=147567 RepID=A0A9P4K4I5_9PLEO|nr:cytochrome P450 [Didymosphaeria enalia]